MKTDQLVYMANQIAAYFKPYPRERAVSGIADHIRKFWEPRMRTAIERHLHEGGEGLEPLAVDALNSLKTEAAAGNPS